MSGLKAVIAFYLYEQRIAEARRLLRKASENSEDRVYFALAAILFAAALEDGINSTINERYANAKAQGMPTHQFGLIRDESLRTRMTILGEAVGEGFFRSKQRSDALHALVTLRNKLLHVEHNVHELEEESDKMIVDADHVGITLNLPTDLWTTVTRQQAEAFQTALDEYIELVLKPLSAISTEWEPNL